MQRLWPLQAAAKAIEHAKQGRLTAHESFGGPSGLRFHMIPSATLGVRPQAVS